MELTLLDDREEIEITIINSMFSLVDNFKEVREMRKAVKKYFGGNYGYAKSIYEEFKKNGHVEIKRHFIDDNTLTRIKSMGVAVLKGYHKYKKKIEYEVNRLFGIDLPKKLNLVIIPIQKSSLLNGGFYYMGLVNLRIYNDINLKKEMPKIIDLLIHEILHAAFENPRIKSKLSLAQEEALISCFAPSGIMSFRVGLIRKLDFHKIYTREFARINGYDFDDKFAKLFTYIKNYYAQLSYGKQNIFDYLADKINFNNKA